MGLGKAMLNDIVKPYTNAYNAPWHSKIRPSIMGGAAAAGVGAYAAGSVDGGMSAGQGAMVGAAVGGLAMPAMGLLGAGISKVGMSAISNPQVVGKGLAGIGSGMIGAAKASVPVASMAGRTGYYGAKKMSNIAGALVKYTPEKSVIKDGQLITKRGKFRPTALGYGVAAGIAGVMGANKAVDKAFDSRAGTPSGSRTATPNYLDNAGATGDLVFAMHQNRRG